MSELQEASDHREVPTENFEHIRKLLHQLRAKKDDPHLNNIDPEELSPGDLALYAHFLDGTLIEGELGKHGQRLASRGVPSDLFKDSSVALLAMVKNKFLAKKAADRLAARSKTR